MSRLDSAATRTLLLDDSYAAGDYIICPKTGTLKRLSRRRIFDTDYFVTSDYAKIACLFVGGVVMIIRLIGLWHSARMEINAPKDICWFRPSELMEASLVCQAEFKRLDLATIAATTALAATCLTPSLYYICLLIYVKYCRMMQELFG